MNKHLPLQLVFLFIFCRISAQPVASVSPSSLNATINSCNDSVSLPLTINNTGTLALNYNLSVPELPLDSVLSRINQDYASVTNEIPGIYFFSDGDFGSNIGDGGNDMYDGGNYLNTDLGLNLPYSENAILSSAAMGAGGKYFTRKNPGLFVFAADVSGLTYFEITGNNGADGGGSADTSRLTITKFGKNYTGFIKRVYNAGDPSINHLVIIESDTAVSHTYSTDTDNDQHRVTGISAVTRIYYLLYASSGGSYIDDQNTLDIFNSFIDVIITEPQWVTFSPESGAAAASDSSVIAVKFKSEFLNSGVYNTILYIVSDDPVNDTIPVPVTMTVDGDPKIALSDSALDYDTVLANGTYPDTLFIPNSGCDTLFLTNVSISGANFTIDTFTAYIPPGETGGVLVVFAPPAAGPYTGTLTIQNNAADTTVSLNGVALPPPVINVAPPSFNVVINDCNDSTTQTLTITNTGSSDLIYNIELSTDETFDYGYICNSSANSVSVFNTTTNTIVATVPVGTFPFRAAIRPDGKYAYICNRNSNDISVIETSSSTVVATIAVGGNPGGIAITPDSRYAYVSDQSNNNVRKIDLISNTVIATINDFSLSAPNDIEITPDGSRAFVATSGSGVTVIEVSTDLITGNIPGPGGQTHSIVITPDGQFAYCSHPDNNTVRVINVSNLSVVTTIAGFDHPNGIDITPAGDFVYVNDMWNSQTAKIDVSTHSIVGTLWDGQWGSPWDIVVSNDGQFAYFSDPWADNVSIIDLSSFTLSGLLTGIHDGARGMATLKKLFPSHVNLSINSDTVIPTDSSVVDVEFNALGINSGTYISGINIYSNDPANPLVSVPCTMTVIGAPEIEYVNTATYLGDAYLPVDSILVGGTDSDTIYFKNTGCDTLTISDINFTLAIYSLNDTAFTILPGDSALLAVTFSPAAPVDYNDSLTIYNNDNTDTLIYLFDVGMPPPDISVLPASFNLTLACDDSLADTLIIYNNGTIDLVYDIIENSSSYSYDSTLTANLTVSNATSNLVFNGAPDNDSLYVTITLNGDFDSGTEYAELYIDGTYIGIVNDLNLLNTNVSADYAFGGSQVLTWLSDGQITITLDNTNSVGSGGFHRARVMIPGLLWVSESQVTDSVPPADSSIVVLNFNSAGFNAGQYTGTLLINSNDPDEPTVFVPCTINVVGDPEIAYVNTITYLGNDYLPIDSLLIGNSATDTFYLKNNGCDTLFITDINNTLSDYTLNDTDAVVLPGDSAMFSVTFTPAAQGDYNDSLIIANNQNTDTIIYLFDVGLPPPVISFNPDTFNITLSCGDSLADTLKIYNNGASDLIYSLTSSSQGTNGTITYSEAFVNGQTATTQATAWVNFRQQLTPRPYKTLKVSGTYNPTGITLTDASVVNNIANAMNTLTNYTVFSQGNTWNVSVNGCNNGIILTVNAPICNCNSADPSYYVIRPEIGNSNWGGINTAACSAPSQTMTVEFSYGEPFMEFSQTADTVIAGDSSLVAVSFDGTGLNVGTYTGIIAISSNDPSNPSDTIPVILNITGTAEVTFSENCLYLDSIMEFTTNYDSLFIFNSGCDTMFITNVTSQTANFLFTASSDTLFPGDSTKLEVTFAPTSTGDFFDTLTIFTNVGDSLICLSGKAFSRPVNSASPDTINITLACSDTLVDTLTIYNLGLNDLIYSTGISGKSLALDGSGDYVDVPDNNTLDIPSTITFETWLYVNVIQETWTSIIGKPGRNYTMWLNSSRYIHLSYNGPGGTTINTPVNSINVGQWHHVAGVIDVPSGVMKIYIDGVQQATGASSGNANLSGSPFRMGNNLDGGAGNYLNGRLDEVRVWNIARTQAEIQSTMNKSLSGFESGLAGYWNFDDGTATDLSTNSNNGAFFGNAATSAPNAPVIGTSATWLNYSLVTDTIAAGDSAKVPVTVSSSGLTVGQYSSSILISSNDPLNSVDTTPVILNVIGAAEITLSQNCMYLDSIMEFTTSFDSLYIKNSGCDTLKITNISAQTADFLFTLLSDTIVPGDSSKLLVTFAPTSAGDFFDTLTVFTNAGDSLICLSGKAFARPVQSHYPDTLMATLACSDTIVDTLTVYNTGLSDLIYNLSPTDSDKSLILDGSGDYIRKDPPVSLPTGSIMTAMAWIYPAGYPDASYNGIVSWGPRTCTGTSFLLSIQNNGRPSMATWCKDFVPGSGPSAVLNQWNHIACVINGASVTLYMNGQPIVGSLGTPPNIQSSNFAIGCTDFPGRYFNGKIDEVKIFSTALSQAEVVAMMNKQSTGAENGLVSYFNFNNSTTDDLGSGGNSGVLTGNAYIGAPNAPVIPSWLDFSTVSDTISAGDSAKIAIEFVSTNHLIGQYTSTVIINSNDPLISIDTVPVIMNVIGASAMVISDTCVFFDTIMEFTNTSDTFYIANAGCDTLFVSAETSLNFFIDSLSIDSAGGYILPGDTELIAVFFAPDSSGNFTGTLSLATNDYDTIICLNGVAFPRPVFSHYPDTINITLACSDTLTDTITIYNTGLTELIFSTAEAGMSADFDGVNDNMSSTLNIDQGGSAPLTLEAWVYPTSNSAGRHQVISSDNGGFDWSILREGGTWYVFTGSGSTNTGFSVDLNQWQHLAAVFIPGTGVQFYKNGTLFSTATISFDASDNNINIGRNPQNLEFFAGRIDEARVWNIQRSQAEITATMDKKLLGNETGLIGYWNYDDGTANDFSGNGNNGTFSNGAASGLPNAPVFPLWLSYSPIVSDTVLTNDSTPIGFQFVSTGLTVGQYTSGIVINSNDPLNVSDTATLILNVIGAPIMTLSDSCITFDTIMEFTSIADTFYIINIGCDTLFISAETSLNFFIDSLSIDSAGGFILPGDTADVLVFFAPDSAGNFTGTLTLNTNDYDTVICLNGVAFLRPVLSFVPDSMDITITECCDSVVVPMTVYNMGGSDLTFTVTTTGGFFDDVENGEGAWTKTGLWHPETAQSFSPATSWSYNTGSPNYNFNTGTNSGSLTSEDIDLTSVAPSSTTTLTFNCFYQTETSGTSYDQRWIQVSVNGGAFTNFIQLSGETMNSWHQHSFDFSAYNGNSIRLRYFFNTVDNVSNTFWGWSVDDISVVNNSASCNAFACFSPQSDTTAAGDSSIVNITFNSCDMINGSYSANLYVYSNDPFAPVDTVFLSFTKAGLADLFVSDSCIAFDTIVEFATVTDSVMIKNTGCDTLFVSAQTSLNFLMEEDTLFVDSIGGYLLPNDSAFIVVMFAPDSAGSFTGTLTINTNVEDTLICFNGYAIPRPILSVTPDTINAVISICQDSAFATFIVSNTGGSDLIWNTSVSPPAPLNVILNPSADTTAMSGSTVVNVSLSDNSLPFGNNVFEIIVNSNDPLNLSDTVVINLFIDSLPPVTPVVNDTAICFGNPTPNLVALGDSIRWYSDGALTTLVYSGDTFATGETAVGIYTYYVTNTDTVSGCQSEADTVILTINAAPTEPEATDTVVCSSSTVPDLVSTGTIVNWYSDDALTNLVFTGTLFSTGQTIAGVYTYYVTDSVAGCAASPADTSTLTINNAAVVNAGTDTAICEGSTYTLSGTSGGGTSLFGWTTSGTGTFDDDSILTAAYTPSGADISAGNVTLTITTDDPDGAGPCSFVADSMLLTINTAATVDAGVDSTICGSTAYTLAGAMGGSTSSITWTSSGTGAFDNSNLTTATYTASAADINSGSVTLTINSDDPAGPCPATSDAITLTLNIPDSVNAGADEIICSGASLTLNGTKGGSTVSTLWTTSGDGTFDDATLLNATYTHGTNDSTAGSVVLTITTDDPAGPCNAVSDNMAITINATPAAPDAADTTVCSDAIIPDLTASGSNIQWYSDAGLTTIVGTGISYSTGQTAPGSYEYWVTDSVSGCPASAADSATLTINQAATANAGSDSTICEGSAIVLSGVMGGSASTITWTTSGDGAFDDATLLASTYTPGSNDISNGSVTLTITSDDPDAAGPCAAAVDALSLTINPAALVNAGSDATICEGSAYTLSGTMGGGTSAITWTTSGSGTFDNSAILTATYTPSAADISAGTVQLIITSDDPAGPCPGAADTMTLTINPAATVSAGTDTTICSSQTLTLSGTIGGSASTLTWTTSGTGAFDDATLAAATYTPSASDIAAGTVTLTITTDDPDAGGPCIAVSDNLVLTINSTPAAPAANDTTVCSDGIIPNLTASGSNIQWYSDAALTTIVGTGISYSTGQTAPGSYEYWVTDSVSGCPVSAADSATLTINEAATAGAGADTVICEGNAIVLSGVMGGSASTITWTTSGDGAFDDATLLAATYTPGSNDISNGSVTLTITSDDPDAAGPCSAISDNMIITINPGATVNAGSDATICQGSSHTLAGAIGGGSASATWSTIGDGTFDNASLLTATYTPGSADISAGTVSLVLTSDDPAGPCSAVTDTMTITINIAATVNAGADTAICVGNSITLNGTRGGGATSSSWTTSGDGTFDDASSLAAVYTPGTNDNTNGTVTLVITSNDPDAGGPCSAVTDTMVLTINAAPSEPTAIDTAICAGETTPNLTSSGTIVQWYSDGALTNLVFTGASFASGESSPGTFNYYVTDSVPGCPASSADTSTLVINSLPAAPSASPDTAICDGSVVPDLIATGDSIRWYDDAGLTNLVSANDTFATGVSATGIYTYYATQTDLVTGCQSPSDTVTLTINAVPSAPVTSDETICFGTATPDLAAAGTNIQWYSDAGLTTLVFSGDSFATGETAAGIYTYYATQTVNNCESPASTVTLTINATPAAPAANDTSVCEGSPNPPLIASGTNIQWFGDSTLTVPIFGGDTFISSETVPGSYTYYANQTINACPGPGTAATLTIKPIPAAPVSSDTSICFGSPVPDLIASGTNLQWYSDAGLTTLVGTGSPFTTGDTAIGSYTYYVTDSLNDCGAGPATAVTLTIDTLPVPPATTDASSCFGDSVPSLIASGLNIQWYSDAGLTNMVFAGDTFATGDAAIGTYTYYATSNSLSCGESSADSATLTINTIPASPLTTGADNCFGSATASLTASGTNVQWYSDPALTSLVFSGNNFTPADSSVGTFTYYATQTDTVTGCVSNADSATLTINALPSAPVSSDTTIIYGNPVPDFTATGTNVQWYSDSALTIPEGSGNNFSSGDTAVGSYSYFVTQSDTGTGCESGAISVTLTILPGAPTAQGSSSCEGDSIPPLSASGTNILWYSDAALTILVGSGDTFTPADSIAGTYTYYATQTVNGFESPSTSATLVVNALPSAPVVSNDTAVCENDVIPVLFAGGTNINWYDDAGLTSLVASGDSLATGQTTAGNYIYYATQTVLGCEGAADSVMLIITANPAAPVAADSSTCFGNAVPDLFASGTNVLWYSDSSLTSFEFAGNTFTTGNTAAGTYAYYAVDSTNGCTSAYTLVNLLISSPANAPLSASTSADPTCPGAPTTLSVSGTLSTGTLWRWYSAGCGGTQEGTGDSIIVSPLTTTSYFVRAEGGCDTTSCVNVVVNVTNTLSLAASGSTTDVDSICPGTAATLSVNGGSLGTGADWQWYSANCGGTSIGSGSSVAVTPSSTTTYYVRAEGTCNTTACDSVTVTIDMPAAPLANSETVCEGQVVPDLAASGTNINWYSDSALTTNVFAGNTFSSGDSAAGVYTYYATETNAGGCEGPATAVVLTINAIPSAPTASDEIGCEGGIIPDLVSTGTFIQWYSDASLTALVASGDTFATGQINIGIYTYYVTDSVTGCEGPSSAVTLTINAIPFSPVTSSGSGCSGDSVASVFATGTNIQWYADSAQIVFVSSGDTLKPGLLPPGTYTYYATQTLNGCESPVDSSLLTVFASPAAPVSSDETICEGDAVPDLVATGTNLNWYDDSLLTNNVFAGDTFATGNTAVGIYTYYATETQNGCISTATTVTLSIIAVPAAPATTDETACSSGIIPDLTASGTNVNWYSDSALTVPTGSGNNLATGQTAIGSYTYYATETVNGCTSSASAATLTIISAPATPLASDESVCDGSPVPDLVSSGNYVQWYSDTALMNLVNTGNTFTTGQTAVGVYTYYITDSLPGCVSAVDSVMLSINPIPSAPVGNNATVCSGAAVPDLSVSGSNITWYSEPMLIIQVGTGNNFATGKTQVGTYTYYATQTVNGCTSAATAVSLSINPNPQVTLNTYSTTITAGQSVTLIAYNAGVYSWAPPAGLNTTTNDTVIASPDSTTTYTVTGSNAFGCSNTASVTVNVNPVDIEELVSSRFGFEVYPNPNKGIFDLRFTIYDLRFSNAQVRIFNMLGEIVYESKIENLQSEVNLRRHGSGVYYVQVVSEKDVVTKRVVVE